MKLLLRAPVIACILFLVVVLPLPGQVINDMDLHLTVSLLTEPEPPQVVDGRILLTYRTEEYKRYVAAAFAHEDYRRIHEYRRVDRPGTDMFFLLIPIPANREELRYRVVVDGLWQADPVNPRRATDAMGREVSVYPIPPQPVPRTVPPVVRGDGSVEFVFDRDVARRQELETIQGQRIRFSELTDTSIYLAGSFNNFDPFLYRLRQSEDKPSELTLTLNLPPGTHYYYFVINGRRFLDPLNPNRSVRTGERRVSRFSVP